MLNKDNFIILEGLSHIDKELIHKELKRHRLVLIEESIFSKLSAITHKHVKSEIIKNIKELHQVAKLIKTKKILFVYLRPFNKNLDLEQFYTKILPQDLGITPLIINPENENALKIVEITNLITKCLKSNRVAQVNIITCRYNQKKELEVLILKRTESRGGFWQATTGGVHVGESLREAASRELMEELSISIKNPEYTDFTYSFMGNDNYILHEYVYVTLIDYKKSQEIKISKEHDEYKWVNEKDAIDYLKFDTNKEAIKIAIGKIKVTK